MSLEARVVVLVVGVALSLWLCVWLTRAVLREMAKGWELDARRRGEGWERGSERIGRGGAEETRRGEVLGDVPRAAGDGEDRGGSGYSDSRR